VFGCRNWFMKVSKDKRHLFSQDPPQKLAKARIQVAKRWGKLMVKLKDHVIRMECARLSFTEAWWCIVIHLFSRYSPRKLAKTTLQWLLIAKAKTQVAKGSRKIIAKDHVILTKSERVFYTAHVTLYLAKDCLDAFLAASTSLCQSHTGQTHNSHVNISLDLLWCRDTVLFEF